MWTSLKAQLFYSSDYSLPTSSFLFNFFGISVVCWKKFFHALIGSQYQSRDRADVLVL